jgi:hypothetical protein
MKTTDGLIRCGPRAAEPGDFPKTLFVSAALTLLK